MTFNDAQLRSDEFAQRSRMFYDQQRYGADARAGEAIQQFGRQVPEIMQAQQALDQRWVDIAQRGAAQQAEIGIAQKKLQASLALDGSELSYQRVRAAKLQNDLGEQQLKEQQRRYERADEDKMYQLNIELARVNAAAGDYSHVLDPDTKKFRKRTDAERQRAIDEAQEAKTRLHAGTEDVDRKRILNEIADIEDQFYAAPKGSPEQEKWKRALDRARSRYLAMNDQLPSGGAPSPSNNGAAVAPQAKPEPAVLSVEDQNLAGNVRGLLSSGSQVRGLVEGLADGQDLMASRSVPEDKVDAVGDFLVRNKARIAAELRKTQQNGRQWQGSDDDAVLRVANGLRSPGDPSRDSYLRMLVAAGILPREMLK